MIDNTTLYYKKELNHSIEKVFEAFTSPHHMLRWWRINNFKIASLELDFTVGGKYTIAMELPNGHVFSIEGIYKEITKHKNITYTFNYVNFPKDAPGESIVSIDFEPTETGTVIYLKQVFPIRPADMDGRTAVWKSMFDKLETIL